jgi:hypothetical protein
MGHSLPAPGATQRYPGGKRFAFTIIDDTDVATVENIRPIYRLFERLEMRTTKTVWPMECPEGSPNFQESETLADEHYRDFVVDLQARGFEIAFHGATMESSERHRTVASLERFRKAFGSYPRIHINHSRNRENVYWGAGRIDHPLLRLLHRMMSGAADGYFEGHNPESEFWWGDLLREHVHYVRNLTFDEVNLLRINPSMPYHDAERPLVRWWFSGTDANSVEEFKAVLTPRRIERLEREGGVCIMATHLGKGYVRDGNVDPEARALLEELARRPGWFPPVGELLDWLRERTGGGPLPKSEWLRMQWRWGREVVARKLAYLRRRTVRVRRPAA